MWVADNYGFRDVMGIIGVSGDLMFWSIGWLKWIMSTRWSLLTCEFSVLEDTGSTSIRQEKHALIVSWNRSCFILRQLSNVLRSASVDPSQVTHPNKVSVFNHENLCGPMPPIHPQHLCLISKTWQLSPVWKVSLSGRDRACSARRNVALWSAQMKAIRAASRRANICWNLFPSVGFTSRSEKLALSSWPEAKLPGTGFIFPQHPKFRCVSFVTGHGILGVTQVNKPLVEIIITRDGLIFMILIQHVFDHCSISFCSAKLPVGLGRNDIALDVMFLEEPAKEFTVRLSSTVKHQMFWRTSPSEPSTLERVNEPFCRPLMIRYGNMIVGSRVYKMVEPIGLSIFILPFCSIERHLIIKITGFTQGVPALRSWASAVLRKQGMWSLRRLAHQALTIHSVSGPVAAHDCQGVQDSGEVSSQCSGMIVVVCWTLVHEFGFEHGVVHEFLAWYLWVAIVCSWSLRDPAYPELCLRDYSSQTSLFWLAWFHKGRSWMHFPDASGWAKTVIAIRAGNPISDLLATGQGLPGFPFCIFKNLEILAFLTKHPTQWCKTLGTDWTCSTAVYTSTDVYYLNCLIGVQPLDQNQIEDPVEQPIYQLWEHFVLPCESPEQSWGARVSGPPGGWTWSSRCTNHRLLKRQGQKSVPELNLPCNLRRFGSGALSAVILASGAWVSWIKQGSSWMRFSFTCWLQSMALANLRPNMAV